LTEDEPQEPDRISPSTPSHDQGTVPADGAPFPKGPDDGPVRVDVEERFPEIGRLKATGALFVIMAGLTAVLPMFLLEERWVAGPRTLVALGLAASGLAVGMAGLMAPSLRRPATVMAPILLVAAAAASTLGASLDTIPPLELVLAFAFGASWILAVEHMHAVGRFVELGAYVTRQNLTSFSLGNVVRHFQVYGVGLVAMIAVVTAVVVVGVPWVFSKGASGTFARSVELASVFGIALAAAVVFTLSALILVFVRSVVPQRVEVERVAYSRDRMEDMLRSSDPMLGDDEGER
jgi:hypothetical protein